jgi:hypothetical protein
MAAGDWSCGVILAFGDFAMDSRASGRLALKIAAAVLLAVLIAKPTQACESCAPSEPNLAGKAANALPTYPEPSEEVAAPVALKKFTKSQSRSARRTQSRKASLAQRANAAKYASRKGKAAQDEDEAPVGAKAASKVGPTVANANAELVEAEAARTNAAEASSQALPAVIETQAGKTDAVQPPLIELVSAEEFNELDRAAWEANQMPKLLKLTASDSRAELRDDDSKWAQTSTIGKLFVAFGALLTLGSAIRMFMA